MEGKAQVMTGLSNVFRRWQDLLSHLSEEQAHTPLEPSDWTLKDVLAHLWAWQQVSVARMQAALQDAQPAYPTWWAMFAPDPDADVDRTNAWIYETNREKPWSVILSDWQEQFERYVELTKQVREEDLLQLGRYPWMGSYALIASTMGTLEHHEEHFHELQSWMINHGYQAE